MLGLLDGTRLPDGLLGGVGLPDGFGADLTGVCGISIPTPFDLGK